MTTRRTGWLALVVPAFLAAIGGAVYWSARAPRVAAQKTSETSVASAAVAPAPTDGAASIAETNARESRPTAVRPRTVRFELVRQLDGERIAHAPVEIEPRDSLLDGDAWLASDELGVLALELAPGVSVLTLRAAGFEPAEVRPRGDGSLERVELTPSSGLFGRVVDGARAPMAGADVRLEVTTRIVRFDEQLTRERPTLSSTTFASAISTATTDARGFYFLPYATRTAREGVRLVAASATGLAGALDVALPREPAPLDELVVVPRSRLVVRVVDERGQSIAGATVTSPENMRPVSSSKTRADGAVEYAEPVLPATITAIVSGMRQLEARLDGRSVTLPARVESSDAQLEIVMGVVPTVRLRVVDAETGRAPSRVTGHVEWLHDGGDARRSNIQAGPDGSVVASPGQYGAREPDTARALVQADGYLDAHVPEIDLSVPAREPIEVRLQPADATSALIRGRVVRGAEPATDLRVEVQITADPDGPRPLTRHAMRTDADGRFAMRWRPSEGETFSAFAYFARTSDMVAVGPQTVTRLALEAEFAAVGPLPIADALASEQVLELAPTVRVPAILRGALRGVDYRYVASLVDGERVVANAISASIAVDRDGDAPVVLLLPGERRTRVTIGLTVPGTSLPEASDTLEFDPQTARVPLVFELKPLFADISGRVVGFTDEEITRVGVAFTVGERGGALVTRCAADGTFHLTRVLRGEGALLLTLAEPSPPTATVLARLPLKLEGDVAGLQLARDPSSLPEKAEQR